MDTREQVKGAIDALYDHVFTAAALVAAGELGLLAALAEPRTLAQLAELGRSPPEMIERLLGVLVALGLARRDGDRFSAQPGLAEALAGRGKDFLRADLTATWLHAHQLVDAATQGSVTPGWHHTDPRLLQAQGTLSEGALGAFTERMFPMLDGLEAQLRKPGARMLDVGAGVAGLCRAFCAQFPSVRVVGLEPAPAPLAEARKNVAASPYADRIELRQQLVQDLPDRDAFDFVWLPQIFLPEEALDPGLAAIYRALKPGGYLLTLALSLTGDELRPALWRLRNTFSGGGVRSDELVAARLSAAGFERVVRVPIPAAYRPVVGRKPA
jgi:SAM-dependent methyltransferase